MLRYARNIAMISLLISAITAALVFAAIHALMVRPIRNIRNSLLGFASAPDDPANIVRVSGRNDELGVTERELASMQTQLQRTLGKQKHLADLGLAVSKINHDMRNILASAQLISDRLRLVNDPTVQTFAPKLKQLRSSGYGARYSIQPLFPSYIFAYFNAITQLHKVNYTRGVQKVVSFCGCPLSISDEAINLIKDKADEDGFVCLFEELAPGDKVRITSGPLQSLVGVFQRNLSDKERVEILLNTINYQSHLLIGREMVEKVH